MRLIFRSGYSDSDTDRRTQPGETLCPSGTAASEVLVAAGTAAMRSCPHASNSRPLQSEIRQKMPDFFAAYGISDNHQITNIRPKIRRNRISGTSLVKASKSFYKTIKADDDDKSPMRKLQSL